MDTIRQCASRNVLVKPSLVPSKAAIRVLCQLAGVGSIGGAVLVADDRRRRVSTISKVRDNGNRIKACRNYQSVAIAPCFGHDEFPSDAHQDLETKTESTPAHRQHSASQPLEFNGDAQSSHDRIRNDRQRVGRMSIASLPDRNAFLSQRSRQLQRANERHDSADWRSREPEPLRPSRRRPDLASSVQQQVSSVVRGTLLDAEHKVQDLLMRDKVEDAASVFLDHFHPSSSSLRRSGLETRHQTVVRSESHAFMGQLCCATYNAGLFRLTEHVFSRIEDLGQVNQVAWASLLKARCAECDWDGVMKAYERYRSSLKVNKDVAAVVIPTCLRQAHLAEAERLLRSQFESHSGYHLHRHLMELISSTWHSSKDLDRVRRLFDRILSQFKNYSPDVSLFNAMIQCYTQADRVPEALDLAKKISDYGLKPDVKTMLHLIRPLARIRRWDEVHRCLKAVHDSNAALASLPDYTATLNPILMEYFNREGVASGLGFLRECVDRYGMVPNRATFNLVVGCIVVSGDTAALEEWREYARRFSLDMDSSTLSRALRRIQLDAKTGTGRLKTLQSRIRRLDPAAVDSGTIKLARDPTVEHKTPATAESETPGQPDTRLESAASSTPPDGDHLAARSDPALPPADHDQLVHAMSSAVKAKRPSDAARMFCTALRNGVKTSQALLQIAVPSLCRSDAREMEEALTLLQRAHGRGAVSDADARLVVCPLLIEQLKSGDMTARALQRGALAFYQLLDDRGVVPIRHDVVTDVAHALLRKGRPRSALAVLQAVYESPWVSSSTTSPSSSASAHSDARQQHPQAQPFSLVSMSVFFRAYAGTRDATGMHWVAEQVLDAGLQLDTRFMQMIKRQRIAWQREAERLAATSVSGSGSSSSSSSAGREAQRAHDCRVLAATVESIHAGLKVRREEQQKLAQRQDDTILRAVQLASGNRGGVVSAANANSVGGAADVQVTGTAVVVDTDDDDG
ncbi:MAG: hypothetical protein M1825_001350 [Sarcosagium campestre]|nr:MAG: hypothetical protein M1825_001350 [Sarcosagium campestre]